MAFHWKGKNYKIKQRAIRYKKRIKKGRGAISDESGNGKSSNAGS